MAWKFEIFLFAAAVFLTVATGGCRNVEPTSAELHPAIQRYFDDQLRAAGSGSLFGKEILAGMGLKSLPVHGVEKITCTSVGDKTLACKVLVDYTFGEKDSLINKFLGGAAVATGERQQQLMDFDVVRTSAGWFVAGARAVHAQ